MLGGRGFVVESLQGFDMSTQTGLITVEEFLKLPEPQGGHYELHHGEVILVPPPKWGHERRQRVVEQLLTKLAGHVGEVRMEMGFQAAREYEYWRADVAFLRAERANAVGDDEYLMGAPDLVVEVLSPSNTYAEIDEKRAICLANGCSSFWVVDQKRMKLTVTEGDVIRDYRIADSFECAVIGATVQVREIFE